MKLQNKKTGEIANWCIDKDVIRTCDGSIVYNSLAELEREWEDVEEPKEYWYLNNNGDIRSIDYEDTDWDNKRKQIGNYFETKEEAEKAVERLRAWKRLKDKWFRFNGGDDGCISYRLDPAKWDDELENDFDLLFSGGEE